ncbi:MerR family transcriptional regulator [Bacillaceae bacterium IKA-2]|nr:MerR family transcriptional regulator [Bacillaceae bacterium IKA-2]
MDQHSYSIKQASQLTGLSKQLIRKWEERYQLVKPIRLDNGYRCYSENDIKTLLNTKYLVEEGHSIKRAASLVEKTELNKDIQIPTKIRPVKKPQIRNEIVLNLLREGTECNDLGMNMILQDAYYQNGLANFLQYVVLPFLTEVGGRWERGEWGEYQESLSSLVVRDYLVQLRRNFPVKSQAPTLLGACLPYEQHDIPLLINLLQTMLKGWNTILLGASPAPGAIEAMIKKLKPEKVMLSIITSFPFEKNPLVLSKLDQFASKSQTKFYLGGSGVAHIPSDTKLQFIQVAHSLEDILD